MAKIVLGVFSDRSGAERAINQLEDNGFKTRDMSIIMKERGETESLARDTNSNVGGGAVAGATTGGIIGALAGLLVGVGTIAIPGIGGLLVAGPIAATLGLTGAAATTVSGAVTGVVAGGVIGGLIGLGVPEEQARVYEEKIKEGGILLAVPTEPGYETEAEEILDQCGADQIRSINFTGGTYEHAEDQGQYAPAYHEVGRGKRKR